MKEERDSRARAKNSAPAPLDLTRVEFHRGALAYLSAPAEARPAVAYLTPTEKSTQLERSCTRCGGKTTCVHIKSAVQAHKAVSAAHAPGDINAAFRSSRWFQGLSILANICPVDVRGTTAAIVQTPSGSAVQIHGQGGVLLATYQGQSAQNMHLFERMQHQPGQREMPTRGEVLVALIARTRTPLEWQMVNAGARTRRQVAEESLWFRLAYHGFCAHGSLPLRFSPAIDLVTGNFTVEAKFADLDVPILRAVVSRLHVRSVLAEFARIFPDEKALRIHPVPVQSLFKVDANTELDLVAIEPVLRLMQQDGEERFFSRQDLERFRYGEDLVYIPELGLLAEFEPQRGTPRKFRAPVRMTLARSQIPALLEELRPKGTDPKDAPQILGLGLVERFDTIEVSAQAVDQDWYWLSINYGAGAARINLRDLLAARKRGERFLATEHGWVDCYAMAFEPLAPLVERHTQEELSDKNKALRVSRRELLRLEATAAEKVKVTSSTPVNLALARMLELQAARSLEPLVGLTSVLRDYQRRGAEWLLFLYDNGQGGLLCDDMGLGKTHQALALIAAIREQRGETRPCLVVCPATVLGHWEKLLAKFTKGLNVSVFYGPERQWQPDAALVLTTYGVLRIDIATISRTEFAVVFFDEAHTLKNPAAQVHDAANAVRAGACVGITGTPIENRPADLWALFQIVLPGYLGTLAEFERRFGDASASAAKAHSTLAALVSPFTLRRKKATVLTELPPKIEDTRTCELTSDQAALYRSVIATRGASVISMLGDRERPVQYLHVFALLDVLKRICDHPALVSGEDTTTAAGTSGKWELLCELLEESLGSGQKVVIYSQYLGMIDIIARHLAALQVGHVVLTGQSVKRAEIVRRFNEDESCRVFVGSLKAGGVGIDLVAASVVIHYDRWWNAAKEDQATDRVHRIGQTRGVQVFKLVTTGTLEERIARMIDERRALAERVVGEDDPDVLKTLSREELLTLLAPPPTRRGV